MLDAMDFVLYLMAITTLQEEFTFGTDTAGMLATVALLTSAAGGMLFGIVADKLGRTRALMATILIFSLCSLGTATAQNLAQLIVWRALLGLGMGGEWSSGAVLVSETWPAEHRAKAIGIMQSGWALGYILAAVLAGILLPTFGWRWLFVAGALPALMVFWVRRHVPEPEVWSSQPKEAAVGNPLLAIFQRALLWRTISATLLTTSVMFAYWGLFSWLPAFLASPVERGGAGLSIVESMGWIIPMQLGAFCGYLSFGFIADRIGAAGVYHLFADGGRAGAGIRSDGPPFPDPDAAGAPAGFFRTRLFQSVRRAPGGAISYPRARHRPGLHLQRRPRPERAGPLHHRRPGPDAGHRLGPRPYLCLFCRRCAARVDRAAGAEMSRAGGRQGPILYKNGPKGTHIDIAMSIGVCQLVPFPFFRSFPVSVHAGVVAST
jgi:MFS family permease